MTTHNTCDIIIIAGDDPAFSFHYIEHTFFCQEEGFVKINQKKNSKPGSAAYPPARELPHVLGGEKEGQMERLADEYRLGADRLSERLVLLRLSLIHIS